MRISSPASVCVGCEVTGGWVQRLTETSYGQELLLVTPEASEVTFRYVYSGQTGTYPEAIFHPTPSRYTRPAPALVDEVQLIAGTGDDLTRAIRIARHVASGSTMATLSRNSPMVSTMSRTLPAA